MQAEVILATPIRVNVLTSLAASGSVTHVQLLSAARRCMSDVAVTGNGPEIRVHFVDVRARDILDGMASGDP